jgi:cytochrome c553
VKIILDERRGGGVARRILAGAGLAGAALAIPCAKGVSAQTVQAGAASAPFDVPAWAFPVAPPGAPAAPVRVDSVTKLRVPHSRASFTEAETRERFNVVDWHPETHGPAPAIVTHGRKPAVMACGFCHMPDGRGRPENAVISGLPVDYFIRQVHDMKSHARHGASSFPFPPSEGMRISAENVTDAELEEAARYFAGVKTRRQSRVVEAKVIPKPVTLNGLYALAPGDEVEPLAGRIIEAAVNLKRHELRDSKAEYVAYVPRGSLARGRLLAMRGTAATGASCASCHGPSLRGTALAPPIAGRSPSYMLRQLIGFRTGARSTPSSAAMQAVAATLSLDDMIAASAYAGSREP